MSLRRKNERTSVAVLFNYVGEDQFAELRSIDPATLDFTPEYDIHVATIGEEYNAIAQALDQEGFEATLLNLEDDISRLHEACNHDTPPDVIFNLVEIFHGDPTLESAIAGLYDLYEIPYTGATPFALELCQRKAITKQVLLEQGVATPRFRLLNSPKIPRHHGLHYPMIVKPASEDASLGVEAKSVVHDFKHLKARVNELFQGYDPPFLIEEFISGKELHVSILGNDPPIALPIIEYDFSALPEGYPPIITYDVKWNPLQEAYHRVHSYCPANLPKKVEQKVKEQAMLAFKATCCRDYARVDIRLTPENVPYILEVNPNPDLTEGVSFMESAEEGGLSFQETLRRIVEFALERGV